MVPLGVQVFNFETESAAQIGGSPQTLVGKAENAKRRERSLPAFRVNSFGAIIPLPFGKLPAQDSKLATVWLTASLKNTGKTLSTCGRTIS